MTNLMRDFLKHIDGYQFLAHQDISCYFGTDGHVAAPVGSTPEYASRVFLVAVMWEAGYELTGMEPIVAGGLALEAYDDACAFAVDMEAV